MDPEQVATIAKATKEILPEVYKDGLQPAVKELGKSLQTTVKAVNVALSPLKVMIWGYEKIAEYLETSIAKKVPPENIITPDPIIAVPAIEALRYTGHNEELKEMFSNLIATAMDKNTVPSAHPSFVEIIKQLNSDEAKILKLLDGYHTFPIIKVKSLDNDNVIYNEILTEFSLLPFEAGCNYPDFGPSYLMNISRLGLGIIDYTTYKPIPGSYDPLINHPIVKQFEQSIVSKGQRMEIGEGTFRRTYYGKVFYESCVLSK